MGARHTKHCKHANNARLIALPGFCSSNTPYMVCDGHSEENETRTVRRSPAPKPSQHSVTYDTKLNKRCGHNPHV